MYDTAPSLTQHDLHSCTTTFPSSPTACDSLLHVEQVNESANPMLAHLLVFDLDAFDDVRPAASMTSVVVSMSWNGWTRGWTPMMPVCDMVARYGPRFCLWDLLVS